VFNTSNVSSRRTESEVQGGERATLTLVERIGLQFALETHDHRCPRICLNSFNVSLWKLLSFVNLHCVATIDCDILEDEELGQCLLAATKLALTGRYQGDRS
jgi:hypothetical protein